MKTLLFTAAAAFALASPAVAGVVYSNNFDAENGGNSALNYNGFNGLSVSDGTVDLVRSGDFGITCAGGTGSCVDLDGSTGDAGLTSSTSYAFAAGDRVDLNFLFSGNQRGGASDSFDVAFLFAGPTSGTFGFTSSAYAPQSYSFSGTGPVGFNIPGVAANAGFNTFNLYFIADNAGSANFYFEDKGGDNVGIIIDNLSLSVAAVPEPSTWAMLILGFGVIGAASRRRRATLAVA